MAQIPYSSKNFPPHLGSDFQGLNSCPFSWADLVWAAITVGKAERSHLMRFGRYSLFELIYRTSILFANLTEDTSSYVRSSTAYKSLDPSEKGAISYFLGLTAAKLFAETYLNVPWLMHLDVYRKQLAPVLSHKKIKPDLVGLNSSRNWVVIEAKGRSGILPNDVIAKAKKQTRKLRRLSGAYPAYRVALACYFQRGVLRVAWEDPEEYDDNAHDIPLTLGDLLSGYYKPFIHLFSERQGEIETLQIGRQTFRTIRVDDADMVLGIDSIILDAKTVSTAAQVLTEGVHEPIERTNANVKIGADGILVQLGNSWSRENMRREPERRNVDLALFNPA